MASAPSASRHQFVRTATARLPERRLVLFPFGQPEAEKHQKHCEELLVHSGGDTQRIIDAPVTDLSHFIRYIQRIPRAFRQGPIVVMTKTNPIGMTVVHARRELERAMPALQAALWFVYLSPEQDPFFLGSAQSLGTLDGPLTAAPIWTTLLGQRYVILSSWVTDPSDVTESVLALGAASEAPARRGHTRRCGAFPQSSLGLGSSAYFR